MKCLKLANASVKTPLAVDENRGEKWETDYRVKNISGGQIQQEEVWNRSQKFVSRNCQVDSKVTSYRQEQEYDDDA